MTDEKMTRAERDDLFKANRLRTKQAEREAERQEKILDAEVIDLMTTEFEARDALWAKFVEVGKEVVDKANAEIRAICADMGIPPKFAPGLSVSWMARSPEFGLKTRRDELQKLAQARLAARTKDIKAEINAQATDREVQLIAGSLTSAEAHAQLASMPSVADLMPEVTLEDLGVKRWQPPEGAAAALLTPLTTADRKRRRVLRVIEANPGDVDRRSAKLAGCDPKTVGALKRERGEIRDRWGNPRDRWGNPHRRLRG